MCRYNEEMSEAPEPTVSYSKSSGAEVENIPLNANGLVVLANQLVLNQAFAQVQSQSRNASTTNLVSDTAAETPADVWIQSEKQWPTEWIK